MASATVADLVHSSKYSNTLLEPNFVTILSSLLPNLKHQHSKVRLAALDSLEALVMAGCGYELLVERVAPAVLPLVHEHAPSVRLKLVRCTARWMGSTLCLADNHQLADQARYADVRLHIVSRELKAAIVDGHERATLSWRCAGHVCLSFSHHF